MKKTAVLLLAVLALACTPQIEPPTGESVPDLGWLFLDKGPYTLETKVKAAPGPASLALVTDRSLMAEEAQ